MSPIDDYYKILGIKRDARAEEIRRAYRALARQYHPDVNKAPDASDRFAEITEAYEVLSDEEKRKAYDRFGKAGVAGASAGAGGFRSDPFGRGGTYTWSSSGGAGAENIGSIFEEMFGGRGRSPFGGARPAPRRGADFTHDLTITFMTAALGGKETLRLNLPGEPSPQTVSVTIPAGVETGSKLRIKGKGGPSPGGGARGDLILTLSVGSHPVYRREGLDILIDLPLTLPEAAFGTTVNIPLLRGTVDLRVPPGTSSGTRLRVKGKGINAADGRTGDFFAVLQIVAPKTLTPRAKDLLSELATELKNPRETGPWAEFERN